MNKTHFLFILLKNSISMLSLIYVVLFLVLPSCRYKLSDAPEKIHVSKINPTIKADPDFDWKMSGDVLFYIKNCQNEVIKISSSNGEILYHKGFSINKNYDVTINLPVEVSQVLINQQLVEITGKAVIFSLQNLKSKEATGYAVCLNGTNGYGEVNNPIISSYPFTVSAWFKPGAVINPDLDQVIFGFGASNNANKQIGVYLSYSETANGIAPGTIVMRIKSNSPINFYSDVVAEPGIWYHVAAVYFSKNVRKLYINGVLKGTHTTNIILPANLSRFDVGRWADKTPDSYFHGSIDEVKIWNYQRTAEQVLLDMNGTFTGTEPGLIGFWPFNENAGTTSADLSSNQRTMELINNVQWCFGNNIGDIDLDGIPDEDDDYPEDALRAFDNFWPPQQATLAFEDLWPSIADYDFNDLVMGYWFKPVTNANNQVVEVFFNFEVLATGAGMQNGFGFSLPGCTIPADSLTITGFQAANGITTFNANGTEAGQSNLTVIPFDIVPKVGNTHFGLPYVTPVELSVKMEITGGSYLINDIGFESFNPFLIVNMVRSHEIHLPDYAPTDLMDLNLFKTRDDASNPPATWYKSFDNLPWGLNFPSKFDYTYEKDTLWEGHLKFINWVNAKGATYTDWFQNEPGFRDTDKIYTPSK